MSKIKIAHEAPKSIFKDVQELTDYDYALVHLLEEDPDYLKMFYEASNEGREIILDNSIFELEEAFDADKFNHWIKVLRPTWYIVPDALENGEKTVNQLDEWNKKYPNVVGKKIGVVQGKTYDQIKACYQYIDLYGDVDMIAISFDYSYYEKSVPHSNKLVSWMLGRVKLLGDLRREGIINTSKPHHLLGSALPQEGCFYSGEGYDWIYSMDTSNPVVHGIKGIGYGSTGLYSKESQKLFTLINQRKEDIDVNLIKNNIHMFNHFWNGKKK